MRHETDSQGEERPKRGRAACPAPAGRRERKGGKEGGREGGTDRGREFGRCGRSNGAGPEVARPTAPTPGLGSREVRALWFQAWAPGWGYRAWCRKDLVRSAPAQL